MNWEQMQLSGRAGGVSLLFDNENGASMARERPDSDSYRRQLEQVCEALGGAVDSATILGHDAARFVYAQKGTRSVNLSWADEGIFVEFWDGDDNVRDVIELSWESAIQTARGWLRQ